MEILIIDADEYLDDWYKNTLKEFSIDQRTIYFARNLQEAQTFIQENLIFQQKHLDVIITDNYYSAYQEQMTTAEFAEWLRKSEETFSYGNFKLSSIPIIVFSIALLAEAMTQSMKYISHVPKQISDQYSTLSSPIKSAVKHWRKTVLEDLEILGIGINIIPGNVKLGYAVNVNNYDSQVLSYRYILTQAPLPYLWIRKDFFQLEQSIEELQYLINDYLNKTKQELGRVQWERQFQDFFKRNPKFLFGTNYSKFWSEPVLTDNFKEKDYKPDFVKRPAVNPELGKNWEIMDLKTPIESFMQESKFHATLTAKFNKCLKQVKDYYAFFNDDHNKAVLESKFSFHPKNPKCTLVIGRRDLFSKKQDLIYENLNQSNATYINIITYDEIVERQILELEQLLELRVF